MQTKKYLRAVPIVFALSLVASYVVYSQLQQTRTVSPGSKFMALPAGKETQLSTTNRAAVQAPLSPSLLVTNLSAAVRLDRDVVASSTKSAAIFHPKPPPEKSVTNQPATEENLD